jgi:hypothetical protein
MVTGSPNRQFFVTCAQVLLYRNYMDLLERLSLTNALKNRQRRAQRLIAGSASILIVVAACSLGKADAYVLEGASWPAGSTITFQMALGNAGRTLLDGNTSWDVAAAPAPGVWDQSMQRLQFVTVTNPSAPLSSGDRVNTIAFSSTVFGQSFGSSTLAVTYYWYSGSTFTEADVLFNNHQSFDSYRGPLRFGSGGYALADIRRVLIHELGHALGLDHPDQHGQHVDAIMNSMISDRETTSSDDINGAQSIYGAPQSSPTPTPTPTPTSTPTPTPPPMPTPTPTPPPETIPAISLSASPTTINEGGSAVFTVTASSVSTVSRTVSYSMSGKAVYGRHYTLSGTYRQATIPAGSSATSVTLNSVAGSLRRGKKTATMTLNPGAGYQLSYSRRVSVTIVNVNGSSSSLTTAAPSPGENSSTATASDTPPSDPSGNR